MPKEPQDHKKPKADGYEFTAGGKGYVLPPASGEVAERIPGRYLRDAAMGGDQAQMKLGFAMLEAMDTPAGALDALYDLPVGEMLEHLNAWMELPTHEGVTLGESSASST